LVTWTLADVDTVVVPLVVLICPEDEESEDSVEDALDEDGVGVAKGVVSVGVGLVFETASGSVRGERNATSSPNCVVQDCDPSVIFSHTCAHPMESEAPPS
jgi:hypothetical protein